MKKILIFCVIILSSTQLFADHVDSHMGGDVGSNVVSSHAVKNNSSRFSGSLSAGYVFKNDCQFKKVYGKGTTNVITADGCYNFKDVWGVGAKLSYLRAKGHTAFLQQRSFLHEIPITLYVRRTKHFDSRLQLYASLGGGYLWVKEKSYLADVRLNKGIAEVEIGLFYPIWKRVSLVGAFRYLFPPQSHQDKRIDVGGFDLRAGLGCTF